MEKAFWVIVICVELVASKPNWGSQATANSGNQPQNLAWQQPAYQNPVPNYSAQQQYQVPQVQKKYTSYWQQQAGSSANAHSEARNYVQQQPVYYSQPQKHAAVVQHQVTPNQYVPQQVYTPPQVSHLTPTYQTYAVPSSVPVHYGNSANVQVLHKTPQWLYQHYPNIFKKIKTTKALENSNAYQIPKQPTPVLKKIIPPIPQRYIATAAAAAAAAKAKSRPGSRPPVVSATATATAGQPRSRSPVAKPTASARAPPAANVNISPVPPTKTTPGAKVAPTRPSNAKAIAGPGSATAAGTPAPQAIPPPIAKAIKDADDAKNNAVKNSTAVIDALQAVVDAARKTANAKSPVPYKDNSTVSSPNPDLNNLNKAYKDSQDQVKKANAAFGELEGKIKDLVQKVQDYAHPPLPSKPAQPANDDQNEPISEEGNTSPDSNAEIPEVPDLADEELAEESENSPSDDNEEAAGPPAEENS